MATRITNLPEELQTHIYKHYFSKYCMREYLDMAEKIKNKSCFECYKKKFSDYIVLRRCVRCDREMCLDCFARSYIISTCEYRGWCNTCIWMDIG